MSNFWTTPVAGMLLDDSQDVAGWFYDDVKAHSAGPWAKWTPEYEVDSSTPRVPVTLVGYSNAANWYDPVANPSLPHLAGLKKVFADGVPIPPYVRTSDDGDITLAIRDKDTGARWEFYWLRRSPVAPFNWTSIGGGAIKDRDHDLGVYGYHSYPPYSTPKWGTRASSFPLADGMITPQDDWAGEIEHAIAVTLPYTRKSWVAEPAQRMDGDTNPRTFDDRLYPAFGYRYFWDVTDAEIAALNVTPLAKKIVRACARYGMVPTDMGGGSDYGFNFHDGRDVNVRMGGVNVFNTPVERHPPFFRLSDMPDANGIYPGTGTAIPTGSHVRANVWPFAKAKLKLVRRELKRPSQGEAY